MKLHATNRRNLMRQLPDGLILLMSAPEIIRNGDVPHHYRQSSNFLYLTGVEEPGYALLLDPQRKTETLFVPRLTQEHAVWLGHIPDLKEARERFGVRRAAYIDELPAALRKAKKGYKRCHFQGHLSKETRGALKGLTLRRAELKDQLSELRAIKTEDEVTLIRKANKATAAGHVAAMGAARPGLFEYQVQAELEREFLKGGAFHTGYGSIVAGGPNSGVLHYHHNNRRLKKGDLLLIDAGAEIHGYTADVTRTFPVSGKFTAKQRDVYEVVLEVQNESIAHARPGITSLELHKQSERLLAEGLRALGLSKAGADELVETEAVRAFYPHGLSHMLGLDVHDVGGGKKRRIPVRRNGKLRYHARLEPGFVITIEPGLYFIPALLDDPKVRRKHKGRIDFGKAERYYNFGGVRIEDDILITAGKAKNLTTAPKRVADVEAACSG